MKGVEQVDQEPDLHRLDTGRAGQAGGHREVDGGQDHHAGDVDGVDQVILGVSGDVVGGLVDKVHEDGREESDHEDAGDISPQRHGDLDHLAVLLVLFMSNPPVLNEELFKGVLTSFDKARRNVSQNVGDSIQVETDLTARHTTKRIVSALEGTNEYHSLLQYNHHHFHHYL